MITEDYCSYEVAKLLKEKGFDEPCLQMWECGPDKKYLFRLQSSCYQNITEKDSCLAPTHQMVMKWLRKNHNILITIIPQEIKVGIDVLCYAIYRITEDLYQPLYNGKVDNLVDSYEEAVEAALKYSLENLI